MIVLIPDHCLSIYCGSVQCINLEKQSDEVYVTLRHQNRKCVLPQASGGRGVYILDVLQCYTRGNTKPCFITSD